MTDPHLSTAEADRLATLVMAWTDATRGANCDAWLGAGNDLAEEVERLLSRARAANVAAPAPTFPHAIVNPVEVYVQLQPGSPEAARYQDGQVAMGCEAIEHAEVMMEEEQLTRSFPWWVRAVMVERAPDYRPAQVICQKTRDLTVTTWRRS